MCTKQTYLLTYLPSDLFAFGRLVWFSFCSSQQWNDALATLDPTIVASRYAMDAGKF